MIELTENALEKFIVDQRWFGSKSREVAEIEVLESITLRGEEPRLDLAIVEVRFQPGTHELYQVPLGARAVGSGWSEGVICELHDQIVYDAMTDPGLVKELTRLMRENAQIETQQGIADFRSVSPEGLEFTHSRVLSAEQSNSSVVLDDTSILKVFRRLGPGVNPELEMLEFLTRHGFENIPKLRGFYAHTGGQLDATLGIVQDFIEAATDGWELALEDLRSDDPMRFVERARSLGAVTGRMHAVLGSDSSDPQFSPADTSQEALGLLTATIDEEIQAAFRDLPEDNPVLDPIRGRAHEIRETMSILTQSGAAGRTIRHHGDYHLGQVLLDSQERWVILDFEGEPARSTVERRAQRSPLRDVAGMLRSFAYVGTASRILHGIEAPAMWEEVVRDAFLEGYLESTDSSLLPPGRAAVERLLAVFELEKAVYELRYELNHRPEWVAIPVAGIVKLLEFAEAS